MRPAAPAVLAAATLLSTGDVLGRETWVSAQPQGKEPPVKVRLAIEVSSTSAAPRGAALRAERLESNMLLAENELAELKVWSPAGASSLVAFTAPLSSGRYLFQFMLKPEVVVATPAEFARYLRAEGLDAAEREQVRAKEAPPPCRERTVKVGKALIQVGEPRPSDGDGAAGATPAPPSLRGAGLPFDLVPDDDPTAWKIGARVKVRALANGKPVFARRITLRCSTKGRSHTAWAMTDMDGSVELEVPRGDRCVLRSIDMRRVQDEPDVDWQSTWHSFTFQRRED